MRDRMILCFYIDIRDVDQNNLNQHLNSVKEAMAASMNRNLKEGEENDVMAFFIPVYSESRIECVNPVLVTEQEAIDNFNSAMEELQSLNNKLKDKIKEDNEKA